MKSVPLSSPRHLAGTVKPTVLDGLARIGSFLALGFSLIGIGWFYSRILSRPKSEGATPQPSAG